jgi:FKBP-type peptidyl-prolyl cis-trans isomerase
MEGYVDLIQDGGIKKKILLEGNGAVPKAGQNVSVHYAGRLENGKEFDSSEEPFQFTLGVGSVIKGWDVGVASMKVGEKCELFIKSQYAYGSRGAGGVIPPNATLIFEVSLLEIL